MTTHQLSYRFTLASPAVFQIIENDPNLVLSEGYVPGSSIRGALAALYIEKKQINSSAHTDEKFKEWFLDERVIFLNANPSLETVDPTTGDSKYQRGLPVPASLQHEKKIENEYKNLVSVEPKAEETYKRNEGSFSYIEDQTLYLTTPRRNLTYHTSRENRSKGRSVTNDGALFVYESLERGQTFEGRLLGSADALKELCDTLRWGKDQPVTVWVGRSRGTQYGGNLKLELLDDPASIPAFSRENGATSQAFPPKLETLTVTLAAPLLVADNLGYPAASFPTADLAKLLGLAESDLTQVQEKTFTRRITVGGYLTIWKLPVPQWPAFAAGSVFTFKLTKLLTGNLQEIEANSLGFRTGEGFGRFILNWLPDKTEDYTFPSPKEKNVGTPKGVGTFKELAQKLLTNRWTGQVVHRGREDALNFKADKSAKNLTGAQLNRIKQIVSTSPNIASIKEELGEKTLKEYSRNQLKSIKTDKDSLWDKIHQALDATNLNDPPFGIQIKDRSGIDKIATEVGWGQADRQSKNDDFKWVLPSLIRSYMLALLTELNNTDTI
jgi:CRISPR-associated protein Csx10